MAKTFKYGGYTFEPRGQFKDFGIKTGKRELYRVTKFLHYASWENRFNVADGDERYNYDEFYKAAGEQVDDVFYCHETGEMYVPCAGVLMVFDQKCTDEDVEKRYKRRVAEREERERFRKREALKNAMDLTEEQHQALIDIDRVVKRCKAIGLDFAVNGTDVYMFRADLLEYLTNNMVPMEGQEQLPDCHLFTVLDGAWDAAEGLYANVKE